MKRNNLIAIAVGAIVGAALSSAYADQQLAPTSDNQPANQQATTVNPSPLGASGGSGDQQPAGQTNGQNAGANGQGDETASGQRGAKAPASSAQTDISADRRDIASDERDIAHDRADVRNDR